VWKRLVFVVMLIGLLPLPSMATAQDKQVIVWHALSPDDTDVLTQAADAFQEQTGASVVLRYVQPPLLFETVAGSRSGGPDVLIADNSIMEPLLAASQVVPVRDDRTFFLEDLLNNLPALVEDRCTDASVGSCLWPRVSPVLPVPTLDQDTLARTTDWLCASAAWLPFCKGGSLPGVPVSWGFNVYLLNVSWMAQQGVEPPLTAQGVQDMRSEFGLNFVEAQPGDIPTAQGADMPPVYVIASTLIAEDPNGVMRSMGSFYEAGYSAVLEMHVDAAYVSAASQDPTLAGDFVSFLQADADMQAALLDSSQRLPAFDAKTLDAQRDTPAGLATLQALVTLTTYAALAY
jgi:hypothetical protein